jgi:transposase-like protein
VAFSNLLPFVLDDLPMPSLHVSLPEKWPRSVKSAVLCTISLAQLVWAYTRSWAANSSNARIGLKAKLDRAEQELALLREQMRIKDARMAMVPPQQRPRYPPAERMAILELKAARDWSLEQTAKAFLITAATVASWMRRLNEEEADALVQLPVPVNKLPEFAQHVVQRIKPLCPTLGKVKIAQTLAHVGLHLSTTTVARMLKEKPRHTPPDTDSIGKLRIHFAKNSMFSRRVCVNRLGNISVRQLSKNDRFFNVFDDDVGKNTLLLFLFFATILAEIRIFRVGCKFLHAQVSR